ncbi:MAG: hypothetical protein QY328_10915 [Anaerolineales bacterium]|nr:hypothetical protein [Anaerolineales bacterium]WKZ38768.1 MAG: hypothetical protein QY328_10915 [Anaerolineales bacterium]
MESFRKQWSVFKSGGLWRKTIHEYSNGYTAIREFVVYSWMVFGRAGQRVAEGISRIVVG